MNTPHIQIDLSLKFKQIVDIVRQLSPEEKQLLSEAIWSEQLVDDMVVPDEHKNIVRERIAKYGGHLESYLSWDDIEQKLNNRK
jgi:hypothetical protein